MALATAVVAPKAPLPTFCSVTVCAGLATPVSVFPKLSVGGVTVAIGAVTPVPVSGKVTVPRGSLLAIDNVVILFPPVLGVNTSCTMQLNPPLGIVNGGAVQ